MMTLMVILLLKFIFSKLEKEKEKEKEEKKDDLLTCMASPQVKMQMWVIKDTFKAFKARLLV